jgi:hypothetical protein
MRKLKLVGFAVLALLAFAAFSASAAVAETGSPQLLLLAGSVTELEGTFAAAAGSDISLVSLSLKNDLFATTSEIKLKNCEAEGANKLDTTLCKDVPFVFTGVRTAGELKCNSTGAAAGEVKGLLDVHFASEEAGGVLEPLILGKVLGGKTGTELVEPLEFKCGGVLTVQVKGVVACLLTLPETGGVFPPAGLLNIAAKASIAILCKVSKASDIETGKCEDLCKVFGETLGFEASFNGGKTFEDVNELVHLKGSLNKDFFIDD